MGTPIDTHQGNIDVPNPRTPDDGLYHPDRYQGGGAALTDSPNAAAYSHTVPAAAAAATEPAQIISQSEWQAIPEPTQDSTQIPPAMSTTEFIASLATPTSQSHDETVIPKEARAGAAPLVPASKPNHSAAYAIVSAIIVVGLIGGLIVHWLRKKNRHLRSKLAMYNNPGQDIPDKPNPHMEQLKRLGCNIKSKGTVSFEAISNMVMRNNNSSDQLRSLESNQSETRPTLTPVTCDHDISRPARSRTKTERFKEFGPKILDIGLMIKENGMIARDKGLNLFKDKTMIIREKGSAIIADKGMIVKDKITAFSNSASDLLSWRNNNNNNNNNNNTIESVSNYSTTWTASTSSDSFQNHPPESIQNLKTPNTSNPEYEENLGGGPSALVLNLPLRKISSGKGEKVESPTSTVPDSCAVSRVSLATKSEATSSERAVPVPGSIGQHAGASTSSTEVFRKKVYRVDMPYKPRNDSQLAVQEGEYAMISQIFDDGWAYCEMVDTKHQGLLPRACLSSWPSKRYVESAVTSPIEFVSPTMLGAPPRFPLAYTPPDTPLSARPRFYGADSVSDSGS